MDNRVTLTGDVVRIVGTTTVGNNVPVLNFFLRTWSVIDDGRTFFEYHPIQVWGQGLERAKNAIAVGRMLRVDGSLAHQSWEDRHGQVRRKTIIRATGVKPVKMEIPPVTDAEKRKFNDPADQKQLKLEPAGN